MAKKKASRVNGSPVRKKVVAKKVAATKVAKKKAAKKPARKKVEVKKLRIERKFPEGQRAIFSNNFVVQHDEATFNLLFFHLNQPLVLAEDQESLRKELDKLESVDAECVARIVVPANLMPGIINALQDNFAKQQARTSGNVGQFDIDALSEAEGKNP